MAQASQTYGSGDDSPSLAQDLRVLFRAFASRWVLIACIIAASLFVGVAYIWVTPPSYTSSVDIFIDPRARDTAGLNVSPTGLGTSSQGADAGLVESQVKLLTSRSVLTRLIEREALASDPEFAAGPGQGPMALARSIVRLVIYGPNADSNQASTPEDRAMERLYRAIKVERVGQTYVLNVAVTSGSPVRSADIANALVSIYLEDTQLAADGSALETAESLEARLAELQATSEASQRAVEDYRRSSGLVGARGVLGDEQQLAAMNDRVTEAVVAKEQARAALESVRGAGTAATSILSSDLTSQLRVQIEQVRSEESVLAATYGDRHPRLVQARENRVALERALETEMQRILARAQSEYDQAVETEASLKTLLAQYEQRRADSDDASVRLRELEQIASQDKQLYETFALRAKQAREQVALPSSTARIISDAVPATQPSGPKALLALAASGFVGTALGFGLAWLLYILRGEPRRAVRRQPVREQATETPAAPAVPAAQPAPDKAAVAEALAELRRPSTAPVARTIAARPRIVHEVMPSRRRPVGTPPSPLRRLARIDSQ